MPEPRKTPPESLAYVLRQRSDGSGFDIVDRSGPSRQRGAEGEVRYAAIPGPLWRTYVETNEVYDERCAAETPAQRAERGAVEAMEESASRRTAGAERIAPDGLHLFLAVAHHELAAYGVKIVKTLPAEHAAR